MSPMLCERKIDLILSDHTRGGQIRLFGKFIYAQGQGVFPEYTKGIWMRERGRLIVSVGLANNGEPVQRLFNPPEVAYVNWRRLLAMRTILKYMIG